MSRSGGNSGKGGRNYRVNWTHEPASSRFTFGDWIVFHIVWGGEERWCVSHKGHQVQRRYGAFEGYMRLKSSDAAMRWVEKRLRERRAAQGQSP
jgi:hypothetical protein